MTDPSLLALCGSTAPAWLQELRVSQAAVADRLRHGKLKTWLDVLSNTPELAATEVVLSEDIVRVGFDSISHTDMDAMHTALRALCPWRKGPFQLGPIHIDSEWRCERKWQRLTNMRWRSKRVLDVGCGNGYYALRALGAGAAQVLGLEPTMAYLTQFALLRKYLSSHRICVLPARLEDCSPGGEFDLVLDMGVLYHSREPLAHLAACRKQLASGGRLVLETLIVEGEGADCLSPDGRYAGMRNVHYLPTLTLLSRWLTRLGFQSIQCVHQGFTTTSEQRSTQWTGPVSLSDFLDPRDPSRTIEGHQAPLRAVVYADC